MADTISLRKRKSDEIPEGIERKRRSTKSPVYVYRRYKKKESIVKEQKTLPSKRKSIKNSEIPEYLALTGYNTISKKNWKSVVQPCSVVVFPLKSQNNSCLSVGELECSDVHKNLRNQNIYHSACRETEFEKNELHSMRHSRSGRCASYSWTGSTFISKGKKYQCANSEYTSNGIVQESKGNCDSVCHCGRKNPEVSGKVCSLCEAERIIKVEYPQVDLKSCRVQMQKSQAAFDQEIMATRYLNPFYNEQDVKKNYVTPENRTRGQKRESARIRQGTQNIQLLRNKNVGRKSNNVDRLGTDANEKIEGTKYLRKRRTNIDEDSLQKRLKENTTQTEISLISCLLNAVGEKERESTSLEPVTMNNSKNSSKFNFGVVFSCKSCNKYLEDNHQELLHKHAHLEECAKMEPAMCDTGENGELSEKLHSEHSKEVIMSDVDTPASICEQQVKIDTGGAHVSDPEASMTVSEDISTENTLIADKPKTDVCVPSFGQTDPAICTDQVCAGVTDSNVDQDEQLVTSNTGTLEVEVESSASSVSKEMSVLDSECGVSGSGEHEEAMLGTKTLVADAKISAIEVVSSDAEMNVSSASSVPEKPSVSDSKCDVSGSDEHEKEAVLDTKTLVADANISAIEVVTSDAEMDVSSASSVPEKPSVSDSKCDVSGSDEHEKEAVLDTKTLVTDANISAIEVVTSDAEMDVSSASDCGAILGSDTPDTNLTSDDSISFKENTIFDADESTSYARECREEMPTLVADISAAGLPVNIRAKEMAISYAIGARVQTMFSGAGGIGMKIPDPAASEIGSELTTSNFKRAEPDKRTEPTAENSVSEATILAKEITSPDSIVSKAEMAVSDAGTFAGDMAALHSKTCTDTSISNETVGQEVPSKDCNFNAEAEVLNSKPDTKTAISNGDDPSSQVAHPKDCRQNAEVGTSDASVPAAVNATSNDQSHSDEVALQSDIPTANKTDMNSVGPGQTLSPNGSGDSHGDAVNANVPETKVSVSGVDVPTTDVAVSKSDLSSEADVAESDQVADGNALLKPGTPSTEVPCINASTPTKETSPNVEPPHAEVAASSDSACNEVAFSEFNMPIRINGASEVSSEENHVAKCDLTSVSSDNKEKETLSCESGPSQKMNLTPQITDNSHVS